MVRLFLALLAYFLSSASFAQTATYRITFTGTWTNADSNPYPSTAHFTELVGATHASGDEFWRKGGLATPGVELVAELGVTETIATELLTLRDQGKVDKVFALGDLFNLPNSSTRDVEVDRSMPRFTLISMLAPSPDWFVGVSNLSLRRDNRWIEDLTVNLRPYDAGTEDGDEFSLFNPNTAPQEPINLIGDSPFFESSPAVATLRFELLSPTQSPISPPTNSDSVTIIPQMLDLLLDD